MRIPSHLVRLPPPFGADTFSFSADTAPICAFASLFSSDTSPFSADTFSFSSFTSSFGAFTSSFCSDTTSFSADTAPICAFASLFSADAFPFSSFPLSFSEDTSPLRIHLQLPHPKTKKRAKPTMILHAIIRYFFDAIWERKYALINISISPSITACTFPVSTLVRWSFTMEYGWNT